MELDLETLYRQHEEKSYNEIMQSIEGIDIESSIPRAVFVDFAKRVYKREK